MRNILLVAAQSIKNNLKFKVLTVVFLTVTVMIAVGLALIFCLLLLGPALKSGQSDFKQLAGYLSIIMYSTCFIGLGINMNVFSYQSMTREKAGGQVESLLVTPLQIKDIWIGKSLAVFLPGMVLGDVMAVIALLVVNYIYLVPAVGFVYTHWMGLSSFLLLPLIYFGLSLLSHIMGLAGKPASGNLLVQIFLPLGLNLAINVVTRGWLDASSWIFAAANIGLILTLALIILITRFRLTAERIVLSI